MITQLLTCLIYANSRGIAHRDIIAENIVICGSFENIKLRGFGSACHITEAEDESEPRGDILVP